MQWFSINEEFPVLEVSYQSGFPVQSWYLDQLHVGQIELDNEIKCYPNPANDIIYLEGLHQLNGYSVELLDAVGNKIHACKNCENISLLGLSQGFILLALLFEMKCVFLRCLNIKK